MKRDFLKNLGLSQEQIDKVMEENGNDINHEKQKSEEIKKQAQALEEQLEKANDTISKWNQLEPEKLQEQLAAITQAYEQEKADRAKEKKEMEQRNRLKEAVEQVGSRDADTLYKLLNVEDLKFTDDTIQGFEEQIEVLKKEKAFLFETNDKPEEPFQMHTPEVSTSEETAAMAAQVQSILGLQNTSQTKE